ncbi:MAG: phosphoribosylformylglycinamidine cyclo-ligase [Gemmatimonadaceae bacterium]|nr:phosphoribosylformylglycinamidine cyclo-ligase [Gemmatimonadaceae bacterium]
MDYRAAGVDLAVAEDAKHRLQALVESTRTAGVLGAFGGFGGMFRMPSGMRSPVLVSSADGVGTKIKVAIEAGRHDTIGHDLVNHCVNDILVQGAKPLFFLDYVAFGKLDAAVAEAVVAGVAAGCRENGCALVGGETAEMPGLYTPPDYDLAGFIVGCVEEDATLGAARVQSGDVVVALPSSGFHTNGYSLVRSVLFDRLGLGLADRYPGTNESVADVLLRVHRSYLRALTPVLGRVHAMAHITGGGIPGNLDRVLPDGMDAVVDARSWQVPDVFETIARAGAIDRQEMFRTFNMGVGMMVVAGASDADAVIAAAAGEGMEAWIAGEIRAGSGRVVLS